MSAPVRIRLSRAKGWRMPADTVKVDRTTEWGNPFRVGAPPAPGMLRRWGWKFKHPKLWSCDSTLQTVVLFHQFVVANDASLYDIRTQLRGKNLACWCELGQPCHADVLLDIANK